MNLLLLLYIYIHMVCGHLSTWVIWHLRIYMHEFKPEGNLIKWPYFRVPWKTTEDQKYIFSDKPPKITPVTEKKF